MARKVKEGASVAYFDDDRVSEPGFYLLEGEQEKDDVLADRDSDSEETVAIVHETSMTPGKRVYAADDWFVYDDPAEGGENNG